jgi:hypothetical protein
MDARNQRNWKWIGGIMLALFAGYVAGQSSRTTGVLQADVTELPRREAFMAGGERSELVLREISATVKKMDLRLENIERAVSGKPADVKKR